MRSRLTMNSPQQGLCGVRDEGLHDPEFPQHVHDVKNGGTTISIEHPAQAGSHDGERDGAHGTGSSRHPRRADLDRLGQWPEYVLEQVAPELVDPQAYLGAALHSKRSTVRLIGPLYASTHTVHCIRTRSLDKLKQGNKRVLRASGACILNCKAFSGSRGVRY